MQSRAPPSGYEALQRSEFAQAFGRVIGYRAYIAPVVGALAVALAFYEPSPWRRVVLVTLPLLAVTGSVYEVLRYRRVGMSPRATELNVLAGLLGHLVGCFVSGGLESPLMPLVLVIAVVASLVMPARPWYAWLGLGLQLLAPWLFFWLARSGALPDFNLQLLGGGPRAGHSDLHLALSALVLDLGILGATRMGSGLRHIFDAMLWRALEANDAARREQAEQGRTLLALTSEIAHELKNPMASVKGLAALLGQQLPEGKGAERLQVLRGEVDRMQTILQEFLDFSRPLVPLQVEPVRLEALCAEVVSLHEGLAQERRVGLAVRGAVEVRCDGRKVRQVLINLVQNALEASPQGTAVELECEPTREGAMVQVLDRGPGLDPQVAEHLFEPGATTKPHGNGVGLTMARAVARQHGGELSLLPRVGGGCAAVLSLPREVRP